MDGERRYERYVEQFLITEIRDDAVYSADSLGCGWHAQAVIDANRPRQSGVLYVAASDEFARGNSTIRVAPATRAA